MVKIYLFATWYSCKCNFIGIDAPGIAEHDSVLSKEIFLSEALLQEEVHICIINTTSSEMEKNTLTVKKLQGNSFETRPCISSEDWFAECYSSLKWNYSSSGMENCGWKHIDSEQMTRKPFWNQKPRHCCTSTDNWLAERWWWWHSSIKPYQREKFLVWIALHLTGKQ